MFKLTEKQQEKLNKWLQEQEEIARQMQLEERKFLSKEELELEMLPYYGAIGGVLTYIYTPTSIIDIIKVRHGYTNNELDLTPDIDTW